MTNVAILGTGYIADYHFEALNLIPDVKVQAVCDLNYRLAEQFSQARGIPKIYTDLAQMLKEEKLDVVHVLTPPHIHYRTSSQIIEAGVDAFIEKPLCHTVADCQKLRQRAKELGRVIGVSHNFLFLPVYEKLVNDVRSGRLGTIDQVDIVWNKELGQIKGGPFGAWMLQNPKNILFEVAPHSFAHLNHLVGQPDAIAVDVYDKVNLPRGLEFYRRWEVRGNKGNTTLRLRFSYIEGYSEHYIHVRGTNGVATVDFENNTYSCQEHTPYLLDIDRFLNVVNTARQYTVQATGTLGGFVLSKMGLSDFTGPFGYSITRAVAKFYETRKSGLDERVDAAMGEGAVAIAEFVAKETHISEPQLLEAGNAPTLVQPTKKSNVLVIGGTGFIGQVLVRQLSEQGYGVRLLTRDPNNCPPELAPLGLELVKGDFTNIPSVEEALEGIEYVYHLAKGNGKTWSDYYKSDVEPTLKLAELCLKHNVKRLIYTSSIAIYYAGKNCPTITEATPPNESLLQAAPYSRSKAESEKLLLELHKTKGLPVVIVRPGVVLGKGGNPYHWGIAAWPYKSVCRLYGDGNNPMPVVLVEDVADGMIKALQVPGIEGQSYNLCSEPCLTANEYLDEFEREAGIKLKRVPTPAWKDYTEAILKWSIKKIGRDRNALVPSFADCEGRSFAAKFDYSKAEKELGWKPIKDRAAFIQEGIKIPVKQFVE